MSSPFFLITILLMAVALGFMLGVVHTRNQIYDAYRDAKKNEDVRD